MTSLILLIVSFILMKTIQFLENIIFLQLLLQISNLFDEYLSIFIHAFFQNFC